MPERLQSRKEHSALPLVIGCLLAVIAGVSALWLYHVEQRVVGSVTAATVIPLIGLLAWSTRKLRLDWARTRERERWLDTTLRSIDDAVVSADRHGRITFMNPVAQQLTGCSEDEARGRRLGDVFKTVERKTREPLDDPVERILASGTQAGTSVKALLLARDGVERTIAERTAPLRDESCALVGAVVVFRDVTEQELAESALRASQSMFRLITDHISDLIAVIDLDGRRIYNSASYERILGAPSALYRTDSFADVHPDDRDFIRGIFAETIRTGIGQRAEYRLVSANGECVYVESVGSVIKDAAGKVEKVLVVSRDIGERRHAEARIRSEKEFSETLINSMPGIFYLYDWRRTILRWNKNFETVTGYTAEEIPRLDPLDFFAPEQKQLVHQRMLKCFAEGSADVEVFIVAKDGRRTPFYVTGLRIAVGERHCMLGVGIDISERLRAEETLRSTMRRLGRQNKVLSEQARSPGITETDLESAYRKITELAANTLEVSRASIWFYNGDQNSVRCADLFETLHQRHSAGVELAANAYPHYFAALATERAIAATDAFTDERTSEFAEGYLRPLGIGAMLDAPIRMGGKMVGVFCNEHTGTPRVWTPDEQNFAGSMADLVSLSLEVFQRRQAEAALREARDNLEIKVEQRTQALKEANEQLKELDRLKSEFVAMMSHELRTPLNSIIGFTGILRQGLAGALNDEQLKQLGMVQFSAKHLLGLINDLLDLSRIESGRMEVEREPFALEDVVREVVESLKPIAQQKKLSLESRLDPPAIALCGDRKKTFQILLNLANNAVKFTERGGVRIEVRADAASVVIDVIDTGIGIRPESMANLFEAFRQVDGSARRTYEGTGLGLYLCRKLASLLSGEIHAGSEFGAGSRFTVTLPREIPSPTTP